MDMVASDPKPPATLGFLTVIQAGESGWLGGYLVLNALGRPLEFHCTAPVRPNRAQEILYGPTLQPYLYGEQIGRALLARTTNSTTIICTDVAPALEVRPFASAPVAWLVPSGTNSSLPPAGELPATVRIDPPHTSIAPAAPGGMLRFRAGRHELAVHPHYPDDRQAILEGLDPDRVSWDLYEPFARIREAIHEAHQGAR